jgi:transposase-like protein
MSGVGSAASSQGGIDPSSAKADEPDGTPSSGSREASKRNRRIFTKEYKLDILSRARELRSLGRGRIQAMLRQEGLRTSHLAEWKKQLSEGCLVQGRRGRPEVARNTLHAEIRRLKLRLVSLERRNLHAESLLILQKKYVQAASLKLERKDRGLLSFLISQVENASSIAAACRALGLSRADFYRTVKPRRKSAPAAT